MNRIQLQEMSLSRVWRHFNEDDKVLVIFTAFRGEKTYETNIKNNKLVAGQLKNAGFGYVFVDGYWVEKNDETGEEVHVKEDSIFAITEEKNGQKLIDLAIKLGKKYNQEAILVKDKSGVYLIFMKSGSKEYIGSLSPGKLGTIYTRLRNNKKSNTFIIESERVDKGFVARLADKIRNKSIQ